MIRFRYLLPFMTTMLAALSTTALAGERDVTFLHISDQHYNTKKTTTYPRTKQTIRAMNQLPGKPYPDPIGGEVQRPRGVILSGDMTDRAKPAEWRLFTKYWGLRGNDGLLNYPMYEIAGNHDGKPAAKGGYVRRQIIKRNPKRPNIANISANGLHYSWDWQDVHFVALNEYAGRENTDYYPQSPSSRRKRQRYGVPAEKSLQFLRKDLASQVGQSDRPVVLIQHYGFDGFAFHPWGEQAAWWTEAQALRLWEAIENYNVITILGGHNGSEARFHWNGIPTQHMDDMVRFGAYHITDKTMTVSMFNSSRNKWERHWRQPTQIKAGRPPQLVQGPYLVPNGEPDVMTVCWRTNAPVTCTLKWGDDHFRYEDGSVEVTPHDRSANLYKHTITNLKRGTGINFAIEIEGRYAPGMFHTTKPDQEAVSFIIADTSGNVKARNKTFRRVYDLIYRAPAYHSFVVHPDALVTQRSRLAAWDKQFFSRDKAGNYMRYVTRRMPIVAPTGASELARTLFPHRYTPAGSYAYRRGPVSVMVLNTTAGLAPGGEQAQWLKQQLAEASTRWRCVVWDPTSDRRANARFKRRLRAICDEHEVELCIQSGERFNRERVGPTTHITTGQADDNDRPGWLGAVQIKDKTLIFKTVTEAGKTETRFKRKAN